MSSEQLTLGFEPTLSEQIYSYGQRASGDAHGTVLTKSEIVCLMLDLGGYDSSFELSTKKLLDPACGRGAFIVEAAERLMISVRRKRMRPQELRCALRAYDINAEHVSVTRAAVIKKLGEHGVSRRDATKLANAWVIQGDFLLAEDAAGFDFVIGNPPYVRIEQIPPVLQATYRRQYRSLCDRADLYVAFVEKALRLISKRGEVVLVCPNRWTVNRYGRLLRRMIADEFKLRLYVDLHQASPFESKVMAYPGIFVMSRGHTERVRVATLTNASREECHVLCELVQNEQDEEHDGVTLATYDTWFSGDDPWVINSPRQLSALRELEGRLRPISETARIGVGVATGNDDVFIVGDDTNIEADRLVPVVLRTDLANGRVVNARKWVINAFDSEGRLIHLDSYPELRRYFCKHMSAIKARHIAKKTPAAWFRTIDRIYPELVSKPKLLIPDIADSNGVVFETGLYLPHHTLYFVTSDIWDVEVLGGLLSSRIALFFVWAYSVKMRAGFIRFQAQYLRRIRLPEPDSLSSELCDALKQAFRNRDFSQIDELSLLAFRLREIPSFDCVDNRC